MPFPEYRNAGGWPTHGFSQSSGIPNVWNWIIYTAIAWVLLTAGDAWWVFGRRPISESQIKCEIGRQVGLRGGMQRRSAVGLRRRAGGST